MDAALEVPQPHPTRRDTATRRGHRCPLVRPRHATWIPRAFSRLAPTRLRLRPIRAESGRLGPESAEIQKKKKKGVERTVWLISKPYFSPVSHKHQNISSHLSSHFVSHFTCLCALCLCFVSLVAVRHSATRHSLSLLLQFILSSALSHAFLTQVSL